MSNFREKIKKIVAEEISKRGIKTEASKFGQGASLDLDAISNAEKEEFGRWVKAKMNKSIPSTVKNVDVVDYLRSNPNGATISPRGLVDMFKNKAGIAAKLGSGKFDKELGAVDTALKAGLISKDKENDYDAAMDYDAIGRELGKTKMTASNITHDAQERLKAMIGDVPLDDMDEDDIADLMDKVQNTADEVAMKYASTLVKWAQNGVSAVDAVGKTLELAKVTVPENEMKELFDIVQRSPEGEKAVTIAQILVSDLLESENGDNLFKWFQDMVAAASRKEVDTALVAAGEKKRRGRPSLADLEARAKAGDKTAIDYLAARAKKFGK